jgi:hypothetical protein
MASEGETMPRQHTTMAPQQNAENTCAVHMISRLFIQNILELPGKLNDKCNSFLHTDEFGRIGQPGYDIQEEDVSPDTLINACESEESVQKLVMFLYIYFLIIGNYDFIITDGLPPSEFGRAINMVTQLMNEKYLPKNMIKYKEIIYNCLSTRENIQVYIHLEDMRPRTLTDRFFNKIKNEYIGCGLYPTGDFPGHAVVISNYDAHTHKLNIKDSNGKSNTEISEEEFLTTGYKQYKPGFFIYLSKTRGGKSKRKRKMNKKSYRKRKRSNTTY